MRPFVIFLPIFVIYSCLLMHSVQGRLALFAELMRNNEVVYNGDFYEATDFELSKSSGDLSSDSIQSLADLYRNPTNGCAPNSTYQFPKSWGLILESGSCSIDTKIQLAKSLASSFLIVTSPPDALKDNTGIQSKALSEDDDSVIVYTQYDFPIVILSSDSSQVFQDRFVQPLLSNPANSLKITLLKSDVYVSGLYEFTLIAIAALLTISMVASLFMHFHLYRMRRSDGQRQDNQNNVQMQIINRRPPVISQEDLNKYPITIYSKYGSPMSSPNVENFKTPPPSPISQTEDNTPIAIDLNLFSPVLEFSDNCAICIDDFEEGDRLRKLPCKHQFHASCIDTWITEKNAVCPLCKFPLTSEAGARNNSANTSFTAATDNIGDVSMSSNITRGELVHTQTLYDDTDSIRPASPDSSILQEIVIVPSRRDSRSSA